MSKQTRTFMDAKAIRRMLSGTLAAGGRDAERCCDIAFHMTDWIDDLERLVAIYEQQGETENEEIEKALYQFLIHVPNHVAAASKLLLDIPVTDIFGVGATSEEHDSGIDT